LADFAVEGTGLGEQVERQGRRRERRRIRQREQKCPKWTGMAKEDVSSSATDCLRRFSSTTKTTCKTALFVTQKVQCC
jgi:hypothetical protein